MFAYIPRLPVYNRHFFPVKSTFKFAERIIHRSHCLVMFSLQLINEKTKQNKKFEVNWFLINIVKVTTNEKFSILIHE